MKTKYTQTETFPETVVNSQNFKPEYAPPKPSEMTNEELEKWLIVKPSKSIKGEIMKRIRAGVKFPHIQMKQYLGMKPFLTFVYRD